jgi:hypothetical protein
MTPASVHLAILRSAALLVREHERAEWLAEWRSELWHASHEPHGTNVTAFCLGALRDAFWLRRNSRLPRSYGVLHLDVPAPPATSQTFPAGGVPLLASPTRCLALLSAMAILAVSIALLLPTSRRLLLPSPYRDARSLVMLTPTERGDAERPNGLLDPYPSVSAEQFRRLRDHAPGQFTGLAFYLPEHMQVRHSKLFIARTSVDLFRLLNIPIPPLSGHGPSLVLTQAAWHKYFGGDPQVLGHEVAGIISARQWSLPANVDGWLIEDDAALAALPAYAEGYVLARLSRGKPELFNYISLSDRSNWPLVRSLLLEFLVGCLWVPISTSFSLGDYPDAARPGRWLFLAAKTGLILPIVLFGSLDLASFGSSASAIALLLAALGGFFAMRWTLVDQRHRCPVCLRLLSNPVRIGKASRILLEWHGSELMCLRGHGLLHVPERPSIWFTSPRWMDLGPSWSGLFPDPAAPTR